MKGKYAEPSDLLARRKRDVILATQRTKGKYVQIENKSMGFDNGVMQILGTHGLDSYLPQPNVTIPPTITFVSYTSPNATLLYTSGGSRITEYGFMVGATKYPITNGSRVLKLTDLLFPTPPGLSQAFVVSAYLVYDGITIQSASRILTLSILINLVTTIYATGIDADGKLYGIYGGDYVPSEIGTSSQISSGMIYTSIGLSTSEQTFIDNQLVNLLMGQPTVTVRPYVKINGNYYISGDSAVFNWNSSVRFTLSINSYSLITYNLNTDNFAVAGDVTLHITSVHGTETTILQPSGTSVLDYAHDAIVSLNATANIGTTASINSGSPGINVTTANLEYNIENYLNAGVDYSNPYFTVTYNDAFASTMQNAIFNWTFSDGFNTLLYSGSAIDTTDRQSYQFMLGTSYLISVNIELPHVTLSINWPSPITI